MLDGAWEQFHAVRHGNAICRNVFVACTKQVCDFDGKLKKLLDQLQIEGNLAVNATGTSAGMAKAVSFKGFANLAGSIDKPIALRFDVSKAQIIWPNWRAWLKKAIPEFQEIPFEKIGLYQDAHRPMLPPSLMTS